MSRCSAADSHWSGAATMITLVVAGKMCSEEREMKQLLKSYVGSGGLAAGGRDYDGRSWSQHSKPMTSRSKHRGGYISPFATR
jgi:hypothetical protein